MKTYVVDISKVLLMITGTHNIRPREEITQAIQYIIVKKEPYLNSILLGDSRRVTDGILLVVSEIRLTFHLEDNLHEMSKPIFWLKLEKKQQQKTIFRKVVCWNVYPAC